MKSPNGMGVIAFQPHEYARAKSKNWSKRTSLGTNNADPRNNPARKYLRLLNQILPVILFAIIFSLSLLYCCNNRVGGKSAKIVDTSAFYGTLPYQLEFKTRVEFTDQFLKHKSN